MAGSRKKTGEKHFKQDINLLEYPLWMQDEKLPSKIPDDKGFIWRDREGYVYRCGYKVPTKLDIVYLMYLLYRSQQEGWSEEIELSRYEVLRACGYTSCRPADYERLEDSLERWKMVGVKFKGTFYDGRRYITISFGVIDTWKVDAETKKLRVRFNREWLTRIKNSSYFKYLSFDQIRALRAPLAMRLYEILVKSFQNREEWTIEARKLAQKIPMKEQAVAHILPKVKAAVRRINSKSSLRVSLLIERPRRGVALLTFRRVREGEECYIVEKTPEELLAGLLALLPPEQRGKKTLERTLAAALRKYGEERVRRNILYANEKVRQPRSYRAFLARAIEEDWAEDWWEETPPEEEPSAGKRDEGEQELRQRVEELLNGLSPEERARLEETARRELPENLREMEAFVRMQMRLILRRRLEGEPL